MSTASAGLNDLHRLHLELKSARKGIDRGPIQIKARMQVTERKLDERNAQKDRLQQLKMTADSKSLQLKSNEIKIADLKRKLNTASSNREFDIIKSQIEADQMANSVLEDEILEAMEKVDEAQTQLKELELACETAKAEQQRVRDEFAVCEPELRRQASELEAAIRDAERSLPASIAQEYQRLVKAHGAGALAPVENNACSACFVQLSPQVRVDLNSGRIKFCPVCGRLMYLPEAT